MAAMQVFPVLVLVCFFCSIAYTTAFHEINAPISEGKRDAPPLSRRRYMPSWKSVVQKISTGEPGERRLGDKDDSCHVGNIFHQCVQGALRSTRFRRLGESQRVHRFRAVFGGINNHDYQSVVHRSLQGRNRRGRNNSDSSDDDSSDDEDEDDDDEEEKDRNDKKAPSIDFAFNKETGPITFTLGDNIIPSLRNGCDCSSSVERALIDYLSETWDTNVYNFLCVAITDFEPTQQQSATSIDTILTFQVQTEFEFNFERESRCPVRRLILCCLQDSIEGASVDIDCERRGCDTNLCPEPTASGERIDLQAFLNDQVENCENLEGMEPNFMTLPGFANGEPTTEPSLRPTSVASDPSFEPTSVPTPLPSESPVSEPSRRPTFQPTVMPTSTPTPGPTPEPTNRDEESEAPSPAPSPPPTLPSPTEQPTLQPTTMDSVAVLSMRTTFQPTMMAADEVLSMTTAPVEAMTTAPTMTVPAVMSETPTTTPFASPTAAPTTNIVTKGPTTMVPVTVGPTFDLNLSFLFSLAPPPTPFSLSLDSSSATSIAPTVDGSVAGETSSLAPTVAAVGPTTSAPSLPIARVVPTQLPMVTDSPTIATSTPIIATPTPTSATSPSPTMAPIAVTNTPRDQITASPTVDGTGDVIIFSLSL